MRIGNANLMLFAASLRRDTAFDSLVFAAVKHSLNNSEHYFHPILLV